MKHGYERYILPDWVLTLDDYKRYQMGHHDQPPSVQSEPPPMERLEIEHRMAQVAANKAANGYVRLEYNSNEQRHSHAVHRCQGNGSRHRANMIGRNY